MHALVFVPESAANTTASQAAGQSGGGDCPRDRPGPGHGAGARDSPTLADIQARKPRLVAPADAAPQAHRSLTLDPAANAIIVRAEAGDRLVVPDFLSNFFFNTLGNLALNPRCGLLFMDFEQGDLLYVAAKGEIVEDGPEVLAFQGAQRLIRLAIVSVLRVPAVLPLRWSEVELSPVLAHTGDCCHAGLDPLLSGMAEEADGGLSGGMGIRRRARLEMAASATLT